MSNINYASMSDREILLVVVERQQNHIESHNSLSEKVSRIEDKIIQDIENRVRILENDGSERKGMYKLWIFIIGSLSLVSILLNIFR